MLMNSLDKLNCHQHLQPLLILEDIEMEWSVSLVELCLTWRFCAKSSSFSREHAIKSSFIVGLIVAEDLNRNKTFSTNVVTFLPVCFALLLLLMSSGSATA